MSEKKATYLALGLLIVVGIGYLMNARSLSSSGNQDAIGPSYFPILLSVALFLLCVISLVKTVLRKEDKRITIPNFRLILGTIVLTVLFVLGWSTFGFFYIPLFIFLWLLLTLYRLSLGLKRKIIAMNTGLALGLTLFIYLVFDVMMAVRF